MNQRRGENLSPIWDSSWRPLNSPLLPLLSLSLSLPLSLCVCLMSLTLLLSCHLCPLQGPTWLTTVFQSLLWWKAIKAAAVIYYDQKRRVLECVCLCVSVCECVCVCLGAQVNTFGHPWALTHFVCFFSFLIAVSYSHPYAYKVTARRTNL